MAFYSRSCAKKKILHFTWCFTSFCAGSDHAVLCAKKWANPFHLLSVFQPVLVPRPKKGGFSISLWCLTPFALALSTLCLCTKNGITITHFTPDVFCMNSFPLQHWSYLTPGHLTFPLLWFDSTTRMTFDQMQSSQSLMGGVFPIALTRFSFAIWQSSMRGSLLNPKDFCITRE